MSYWKLVHRQILRAVAMGHDFCILTQGRVTNVKSANLTHDSFILLQYKLSAERESMCRLSFFWRMKTRLNIWHTKQRDWTNMTETDKTGTTSRLYEQDKVITNM